MQRSTLAALPFCLVILSQTCFQARASPIPRNFHPLDSPLAGCLTVIFFLALLLIILFVFKKIYVARRRKIDPVSIFSDEFPAQTSNWKGGSITKAIANKSGFYVGLLGSPGWETKHSVFIGGGPRHISLLPESRTLSCRCAPFGSPSATILHDLLTQLCEARHPPSNVLRDKLQPLNMVVLSPELSHPPPAVIPPKHPSPCFDTKPLLRTRHLSSPLITQDDQHGRFRSNENITLNLGLRKLVSGLDSFQSLPTDHFKVSSASFTDLKDEKYHLSSACNSSVADIAIPSRTFRTSVQYARLPTDLLENSIQQSTVKPLHFGLIPKSRAHWHTMSGNFQQISSNDTSDSTLEIAAQDFSAVSPQKAFDKILHPSSNSIQLKPRCSMPTKRTGNSPVISPSPLRTMSLPLDYDLEHAKQFDGNNCIQSEAKFESLLEFPPSSHSTSPPKRSKTVLQADDPDIILNLIRELAQETSAWDASLFVDKNFKALMDQSKTHPSCKLEIQIAQERRSKHTHKQRRTTSFIPLQDIPESDVAVVFSKENDNWHPGEAQSFWEDEIDSAYRHDAQPEPLSPCAGLLPNDRV